MSECTHDCSTCGQNCASREPQSLLEKPNPLSHIKRVIGVLSGKGGVGKSMVTALLAINAQRQGLKVGILDADVTGPSIPMAFGLTQKAEGDENGIYPVLTKTGIRVMSLNLLLENESDPVAWRGPIIAGTVKQFWTDVIWGDLDVLYIDMPPGTGDVTLTVFQSIPVDGVVIVSTPQGLVRMIVEKAVKLAKMMNIPVVGLVENMAYVKCPGCEQKIPVFGQSTAKELAKAYDIPSTAELPIDPKLAGGCDKGVLELYNGDWLDALTNAIVDMPPRKEA